MIHWIILFDPWQGLKMPSPALYPDWGNRLRYYPGSFSESHELDIAEALAENGTDPDIWLLVPSERTEMEVCELIDQIKTLLKVKDLEFQPYQITWRIPQDLQSFEAQPSLFAGIRVDLSIDDNVKDDSVDWARLFLLPLAIRFLMERERFLSAQERKNIARLELKTNRKTLTETIEHFRSRLVTAAKHVRYKRDELERRGSEERFFDTELVSCEEFIKEYRAQPCSFGYYYKEQVDEYKAVTWIREETEAILQSWLDFEEKINRWRQDRLHEIPQKFPDKNYPNQSPKELQTKFQADLKALSMEQGEREFSRMATRQAKDLIDKHTDELVSGLRRRPSWRLFIVFFTLLSGVGPLFNAFGANLPRISPTYSWMWPVVSFASLAIFFLLVLACAQRGKKRALARTKAALSDFFKRASGAGDKLKNETRQMIVRILLNRNLEIVEREIRKRERERSQWDYHLGRLKAHFNTLDSRRNWEVDSMQDSGSNFDPSHPEWENSIYFWSDSRQKPTRLVAGQEERNLAEDTQGRFAGIVEIVVSRGA